MCFLWSDLLGGREVTHLERHYCVPVSPDLYVAAAARETGSVAELAATRIAKYAGLDATYTFQPIARVA